MFLVQGEEGFRKIMFRYIQVNSGLCHDVILQNDMRLVQRKMTMDDFAAYPMHRLMSLSLSVQVLAIPPKLDLCSIDSPKLDVFSTDLLSNLRFAFERNALCSRPERHDFYKKLILSTT